MNNKDQHEFIDYILLNKKKWKGLKYYLLSLMGFMTVLIYSIINIKIFFFIVGLLIYSPVKNTVYNDNTVLKNENNNIGYDKFEKLNAIYEYGTCDTNLLASHTRSCLINYLKSSKILNTEQNQKLPYTECLNTLIMNEYFTNLLKEYIEFIKNDICSDPDTINQKSMLWFNTRIIEE